MPKIKLNAKVRELLVELDDSFTKYGQAVENIAERRGNEIEISKRRNLSRM